MFHFSDLLCFFSKELFKSIAGIFLWPKLDLRHVMFFLLISQ